MHELTCHRTWYAGFLMELSGHLAACFTDGWAEGPAISQRRWGKTEESPGATDTAPGRTPMRLCTGVLSRGAHCEREPSVKVLDTKSTCKFLPTPLSLAGVRICSATSLAPWSEAQLTEDRRRPLGTGTAGLSALLKELCVLNTHFQGQSPPFSL